MADISAHIILALNSFIAFFVISRFGVADARTVVALIFVLYNISYPIDSIFFGARVANFSREFVEVGAIFTLFISCFVFGAGIINCKLGSMRNYKNSVSIHASYKNLFLISIIVYFLCALVYWDIALADRNALYLEPVTSLMIAKSAVAIYFLAVIVTRIDQGKISPAILLPFIAFVVVEVLVFGDRRLVASCLLTAFVLVNSHHRVRLKFKHIVGCMFFAFVMLWVEITRYGGVFSEAILNGATNPSLGELGASWYVAMDIYRSVDISEVSSSSFIQSFGVLVPRFIWPDRPLAASQWFVQEFYPEIAAIGGGFAFSFPIEVLINLSIIGYIVFCFLFGLAIGVLAVSKSVVSRLSLCCIVFSIVFLPRMDSATILKSFLISFVLLALPWCGIFVRGMVFRRNLFVKKIE